MTLRRATAADAEAIAVLWRDGWLDGHRGHVPDELVAHRGLDDFRARVPGQLDTTTVAVDDDGRIAGFVTIHDDELDQMYVAATARGSGVADELIAHAEMLIGRDHDTAWLAVVAGNGRARRFYERRGWRDDGPLDYAAAVAGGTFVVPSRRYLKRLGSGSRPLAEVDVAGVAEALDDGSHERTWWYDPATGQVEPGVSPWFRDRESDDEDDDPLDRGLVAIESFGSRDAYEDMVDFAEAVGDRRAADLLLRALEGRGAFRRFRDTLHDFADLIGPWRDYSSAAAECRAIRWLEDERLISAADAATGRAEREAQQGAVLDAIGRRHELDVAVGALAARWADVEAAVDAGRTVVLRRNGRPWATITPT